jgi:hypothetical protein
MLRSLSRILAFAALLLGTAFAVIVVNQTLQLADFAGRWHPSLGTAVFWGLIGTYLLCLAVPVLLYFRLPAALKPPARGAGPEFERYLRQLARRLGNNPATAKRPLRTRREIEEAIGSLDARVDEILSRSASRVFLTTAISQSGALDSLVVLAAQLKQVWDIAHVYNQRPGLRELGTLYANVLGTAFVAGQIEELDLSEHLQPVLSSVLGSAASAVPGLQAASTVFLASVLTGTANAFLTLRVGMIAREYSRAMTRPERSALRRSATAAAAVRLGSITLSGVSTLSRAVIKASGQRVGGALSGLIGRLRRPS